jgi:predicted RNA-binding protein with PIN domain
VERAVSQLWIIDAYNLLFRFPDLREKIRTDLESARNELVRRVERHAAGTKAKYCLVFDGGHPAPIKTGNPRVSIVFSSIKQTADNRIKQILDEMKRGQEAIVVSSDLEVSGYARTCGAAVRSSHEFAELITVPDRPAVADKYDPPVSKSEMEEWMRIFKRSS